MRFLIGIGLKVVATLLFTIMGALIKAVGDAVPLGQIIFSRNFFALLPILALLAWRGELKSGLKTSRPGGHVLRALIGGLSMFFVFAALQRLTLADATAIGFATPIFSVVFAVIILGEVVRIYRWSAVAVGFVGVFVMLSPYLTVFGGESVHDDMAIGAVFALLGAIGSALAMIQVRRLTKTETTPAIVFYFSVVAALMGLATLPTGWAWASAETAMMLVGIGIVGGIAQIFLTESYRHAPASLIAPFDYLTMLWSVVIGYLFFAESPTGTVLAGAAIVIAAGLFVIYREARIGLDRSSRKLRMPFGG